MDTSDNIAIINEAHPDEGNVQQLIDLGHEGVHAPEKGSEDGIARARARAREASNLWFIVDLLAADLT